MHPHAMADHEEVPRYFTLEEAEQSLADLERSLRQAQQARDEFQVAESILQSSKQRIERNGGSVVNINRAHALNDQRDHALKRLKRLIQAIHQEGCLVKDLDLGAVDFPTRYRGEEAVLSWRLGETKIRYWREPAAAADDRQEIDDDFRAHHGA
jgi:hypothetical protein